MLQVGLVGFGMAGRVFHAPLISSVDGLRLAAVVERHGKEAAQRYPGIATFGSLEQMLGDPSLDLIVIATPSGTHFDAARQALEAGRNVVVDKPMTPHSSEIATLIKLAKDRGVALIPFHNRHWDSDFLTVNNVIREGSLGRLVSVESRLDRWKPGDVRRPWKDDPTQGGGLLLDLGTHLAYQALALFGKPIALSAEVLRERDGDGADDSFAVRLRYEGLWATLGANALSFPAGARFVLRGTKGNYRKDGVDPQEAALNKVMRITDTAWGQEPASAWGTLTLDVDGSMVTRPVAALPGDYRLFYAGVRDALLGKAAPPVSALEAWRVSRLLEWAQASSDQRREITCNWSEEPPIG